MKCKLDNSEKFLQLYDYTDKEIAQIRYSFKRRIANWRYHPLVKKKLWDGYINFVNEKFGVPLIPVGLWSQLSKICKEFDLEFYCDDFDKIIDYDFIYEEFEQWVYKFFEDHPDHKKGGPKEVREYQIKSAYNILKFKISCSEIATSAGKTLIMFIIFAYLFDTKKISKYLIVVPNTSLIIQGMEDFEKYNNNKLNFKIQPIHAGTEKRKSDHEVIIGTFQSLTKREDSWFDGIDAICIDEAHFVNSKSVRDVITKCKDLKYRYGLSGTVKKAEDTADYYTIQAYLGPYVNDISAKFLIDNKYATEIFVKVVRMDYLEAEIKEKLQGLLQRRYEFEGTKLLDIEKKLVIDNRRRFLYVTNFISKTTKNSLVLFADVKYGYGRKIYDWLRQNTDKKVYYIDGGTSVPTRTQYFEEMEEGEDKILVASFGICATGISINNLYNIFLVESFKSDKIIRQAIGRGMRLKEGKERTTIIDFCDDFSMKIKNYLRKHSDDRITTYKQQGFPYKIFEIKL